MAEVPNTSSVSRCEQHSKRAADFVVTQKRAQGGDPRAAFNSNRCVEQKGDKS
jgi:hypothetical protein